ncbi:hypothetical protein LguiB_032610 [Lonicera macranthoides]
MSKVILGMPGPWAEDNYEASDHYTTKIGGLPDWPILNTIIRPDLLECSICKSTLCLVAQIYAPILSIEERLIYVFGCVALNCGSTPQSWRALRVQRPNTINESNTQSNEVVASTAPSVSSSKTDLDSKEEKDDDDIDLDDLFKALSDAANIASSHSNKKNSHCRPKAAKPKKTSRVVDNDTPVVPCFYLYTQEEAFSKKIASVSSDYASLSIKDNHSDLEGHVQEEKWDEEGYEYDRALNADRTYLKFKKRLDAYPEQCFRYSYGGEPLLATAEAEDLRTCNHCGCSRHYEMQLMPPLLYFLESATNDVQQHTLENWNWMTLIVYTCSQSCSKTSDQEKPISDGWFVAEEAVVLQYE